MKNVVKVNGYIRAVADHQHPLQTKLSLILTDFSPNGNKQGIPLREKQNIISTAQHTPLKINFDGAAFHGHVGAIPIGTITNAFEGEDNGRDVILGDAVIWDDLYEDVSEHMKAAFAEGVGTSWEIYFTDSTQDDDGVQWLNDCIFAGTCVVDVPAYGPNRTRILAIAEKLNEVQMPKEADETREETQSTVKETQAEDLTETRNDLNDAQDLLFKLWEGLDNLYTKTFEIEEATVETDIGKIAAAFADRIAKIADHIASLSDKIGLSTAELETVTAERDQLKNEKAEAERKALATNRKARLSEVGIEVSDDDAEKLDRYLSMADEVFSALIADFSTARKVSTAEQNITLIPEPIGSQDEVTTEAIAAELRKNRRH